VSAPALGRRWWAARGEGAFADGVRCRVSGVSRLEDAMVSATSTVELEPGWSSLARSAYAARGFSDFWQYCLVAEGSVDAACDATLALWDYAAVQLVVEEAGGRCSTATGAEPAPGESFVATNGVLHDAVVSLLGA
jgi:histidinol-phosphatase